MKWNKKIQISLLFLFFFPSLIVLASPSYNEPKQDPPPILSVEEIEQEERVTNYSMKKANVATTLTQSELSNNKTPKKANVNLTLTQSERRATQNEKAKVASTLTKTEIQSENKAYRDACARSTKSDNDN